MYCVCSIHEVPSAVDWPTVLVTMLAIPTVAVGREPSLVAGHSDIVTSNLEMKSIEYGLG